MTFVDGVLLGFALGLALGLTVGLSMRPFIQMWNVLVLRRTRGR